MWRKKSGQFSFFFLFGWQERGEVKGENLVNRLALLHVTQGVLCTLENHGTCDHFLITYSKFYFSSCLTCL